MPHDPFSPNGVRRWGLPYHGLWKGGQITLPNGTVKTMPSPVSGSVSIVRVPGMAEITPSEFDTAEGLQWLNYLIVNPGSSYPAGGLSWVYTKDGPGKLVSLGTNLVANGAGGLAAACTMLVPFGAAASAERSVTLPGLPGGATFQCASQDGSEAYFKVEAAYGGEGSSYRWYKVALSGAVIPGAPGHGLSAVVTCVNPDKFRSQRNQQWYQHNADPYASQVFDTDIVKTHMLANYRHAVAYDHTGTLRWCETSIEETRTYTSVIWDYNGAIGSKSAVRQESIWTMSITYGGATLYGYQFTEDTGWVGPYGAPPGQLDAPLVEDTFVETDLYSVEGAGGVYDGCRAKPYLYTNTVIGLHKHLFASGDNRLINAYAPSGLFKSFDVSSAAAPHLTWHPVLNDLRMDTELIAWI